MAIIVGGERVGLKDTVRAEADEHIVVPMHGHGSSLTVSVIVGIILFEAERQRRAAGLYDQSRLTPTSVIVRRSSGRIPTSPNVVVPWENPIPSSRLTA